MPHLQFECTLSPSPEEREEFIAGVMELYADVKKTGTGHIAVTVRSYDRGCLMLGRAGAEEDVCLLNADIRQGRTLEQRREFALSVMNEAHRRWNIPRRNMYVIYTEHPGEDFMLHDRILAGWSAEESSSQG